MEAHQLIKVCYYGIINLGKLGVMFLLIGNGIIVAFAFLKNALFCVLRFKLHDFKQIWRIYFLLNK